MVTWSPRFASRRPAEQLGAEQLRHPSPATEALLPSGPVDLSRKRRAHEVTQRQGALLRQELRQRRMDSWLEEAPIRMLPKHSKLHQVWADASKPLRAVSCAEVSREVYRRNGHVMSRTPAPLKSKSLSLQCVLLQGQAWCVLGSTGRERVL